MKGDWRYYQDLRMRGYWRRWHNWTTHNTQAERVIAAQKRHFQAIDKVQRAEIAQLKRDITRLKFWDQKTP